MSKPNLYVLAGVNGAGKSSVGGRVLKNLGLQWYNPDTLARLLMVEHGMEQQEANIEAWKAGMAQLDKALAQKTPFAFETTLGGNTVRERLKAACESHEVRIWYCGLSSPEMHLARIRLRVSRGGHDIPAEKIRERREKSRANLVALLPLLAEVGVFDNSATVQAGEALPEPKLVLHLKSRQMLYPRSTEILSDTPEWAQAIMEKALEIAGI